MASFTRKDYEFVYEFAVAMADYFESQKYEKLAVEVVALCESAIGQQSTSKRLHEDFPQLFKERQ